MVYRFLNSQLHNIELSQLVSDGKTADGDVYREDNLAIKILHSPHMTLMKAKEFCQLNTKYILLPRDVIYNENNKYVGYVTKYIQPIKNGLLYTPTTTFIDNIHGLKKDIDLLDENNIIMDDVHKDNTIESDELYFIDTDRYYKKTTTDNSIANIDRLNAVIERIIIEKFSIYFGKGEDARQMMRKVLFSLDSILESPEIFVEREFIKYDYVGDYFEEKTKILKKDRNSKVFIRR